jgi:hypothetical protein
MLNRFPQRGGSRDGKGSTGFSSLFGARAVRPGGTIEPGGRRFKCPYGTPRRHEILLPSDESLGYCQVPLRGTRARRQCTEPIGNALRGAAGRGGAASMAIRGTPRRAFPTGVRLGTALSFGRLLAMWLAAVVVTFCAPCSGGEELDYPVSIAVRRGHSPPRESRTDRSGSPGASPSTPRAA